MPTTTAKEPREVQPAAGTDLAPKLPSPNGDAVAVPVPPMDGSKPVAAGDKEVEKFLVATDTGGGD